MFHILKIKLIYKDKKGAIRLTNIFSRTEKKYLLTRWQYEQLVNELKNYLIEDKYHNYKICNIYYDTKNYELFRLSSISK